MLVADFFTWWYGRGWRVVAQRTRHGFRYILAVFSFGTLLRTLGSPWRRIISYPGASLDAKLRAAADNAFSRAIGFVIRVSVLLTAGICSAAWAVFGGIVLAIWPVLPLAVPICIVLGFVA